MSEVMTEEEKQGLIEWNKEMEAEMLNALKENNKNFMKIYVWFCALDDSRKFLIDPKHVFRVLTGLEEPDSNLLMEVDKETGELLEEVK